jgi:MFS family permease
LALGTAETLHDTAAQAVVPQLVPQGSLSRANGRLQAVELATNQFIGPPVGGLLVGVGVLLAFAGPAAVFAAAAGALLLLRGHFRVRREHSSTVRADIVEGVRFLARHRLLRRLAGMTATFNLATSATFAVFVLYAVRPTGPVGLTPTGYGVLLSLLAAGTVAGALLAGRIEARLSRFRCLLLGILGGVLMIGAPAVTSSAVVIGAAFVLGGGALALWNVVVVSLRQRLVPERLLGRVTSAYRLLAWGTQPLGAGAAGVLGELLGLRAVFLASVTVALLTLLGLKGVTDESIAEAERRAGD